MRRQLWFITIFSVPIVWAVGYQDHPWRQPFAAFVVAVVLLTWALILRSHQRRRMTSHIPRWLIWAAIIASGSALLLALFWYVIEGVAIID